MRIQFKTLVGEGGETLPAGTVHDVTERVAMEYVHRGLAVLVDAQAPGLTVIPVQKGAESAPRGRKKVNTWQGHPDDPGPKGDKGPPGSPVPAVYGCPAGPPGEPGDYDSVRRAMEEKQAGGDEHADDHGGDAIL